jgi:hypothetical protein
MANVERVNSAAVAGWSRPAGLGPVALFCVIWSSAFAAAKLALPHCPPHLLLTGRFLCAGALMMAAAS